VGDGAAQLGIASWYGHPFDGRLTSNGEVYDMEKLTAAHRTFPFGTVVRVENLSNQKTVEVRINDRGPFVQGGSSISRMPRHRTFPCRGLRMYGWR